MKKITASIITAILGCVLLIANGHTQFANCADNCRNQLKECRDACRRSFGNKRTYDKCQEDCDDAWRVCRKKCF